MKIRRRAAGTAPAGWPKAPRLRGAIQSLKQVCRVYTGSDYQVRYHDTSDFADYQDAITATFVVDMDMDTDLDFVVVAGVLNKIYWFENSLLTPVSTVPTADAGEDKLVIVDDRVHLDGSESRDPESDPLTFSWSVIASPDGSSAALDDAATDSPSFVPDRVGEYRVALSVSDAFATSLEDTVSITAVTFRAYLDMQLMKLKPIFDAITEDEVIDDKQVSRLYKHVGKTADAIRQSRFKKAVRRLRKLTTRTDGCIAHGSPDTAKPGNDWITDCAVQTEVYDVLQHVIDTMTRRLGFLNPSDKPDKPDLYSSK